MKRVLLKLSLLAFLTGSFYACSSDDDTSNEVEETVDGEGEGEGEGENNEETTDGTSFDETELGFVEGNVSIQIVEIDGIEYYEVTTSNQTAIPAHQQGPWCPYDIEDDTEEEGGIWIDNESDEVYQVTYNFLDEVVNTLYAETDEENALWDAIIDGDNVNYTVNKEECEGAAQVDVADDLKSHCVECLPSFFEDELLESVFNIPVTPIKLDTPQNISGTHGISFNGVIFEASAPVDIILASYTIAAFDNAGGHVNPFEGYHYHTSTGMTVSEEQTDGHADKIGLALDGFSLYDYNQDIVNDLDDCNGHEDDERGYHYHVSSPGTNEFLPCFYGQAEGGTEGGGPGGGGPGGMM